MQLFSPPKLQFPHFQSRSPIANPSTSFKPQSPLLRFPPRSSPASLQQQLLQEEAAEVNGVKGESFDELLIVRRPVKEEYAAVEEEEKEEDTSGSLRETDGGGDGDKVRGEGDPLAEDSSGINSGLNEFAKKMPMFEPLERVGVAGAEEKPLPVNLELALYRAKVLGRSFRFKEAQKILRKCIFFWPEDGRAYVALGKILGKQSKYAEARVVYESGCQATQGENPYIWQCWAVLENKLGNIRRARELFDAATVADKKHVAAWHGWAVLEIKEGNIKKARSLLGKGLKFCGGNEYIYQTLALLEAKANRIDQARYLFQRATVCNPKSCASWLAWAQLEMQQENKNFARKLFEKAVQASPKNRFAWHVWAMFEASQGDIDQGRKLLKIGHTLNPRDPVLLQSLALLEYRHSTANLARVLFRRASELDPRHQPVWMAWGWMEWKEGNISTARELYQKTISIDSTSETAARCLQAWGVLEQRLGNLTAARRLFRSSLNINSQSYITWMTWASLEEEQGNAIRAEEIRNLYFQQRTEVVDDASWVMGFLDIIDPAVDSIKRLLNLDQKADLKGQTVLGDIQEISSESIQDLKDKVQEFSNRPIGDAAVPSYSNGIDVEASEENLTEVDISKTGDETMESLIPTTEFDLDAFIMEKLSINASDLDPTTDTSPRKIVSSKRTWKSQHRTAPAQTQ